MKKQLNSFAREYEAKLWAEMTSVVHALYQCRI